MEKQCVICNKIFETKSKRAKYCSKECTLQFNRLHGKEKRQHIKAMKEISNMTSSSNLSDKVNEANAKGISYGTLVAQEQAKTVKIERKKNTTSKKVAKPKKKSFKAPVIYEFRKIQFDECVEQWLYNEEHSNE